MTEKSREHDMKVLDHCHCSATAPDGDMVEMDVCECEDGWYAVYDHWGDGGYEPQTWVAKFLKEDEAYLFVYRRLADMYGKIVPWAGAGCPNEFLSRFAGGPLAELTIDAYLLYENPAWTTSVTLQRMPQRDGSIKWAILKGEGSVCLDKDGDWIIQSQPSSRDDEYFEKTRWLSPEEALSFWNSVRDATIEKLMPPAARREKEK